MIFAITWLPEAEATFKANLDYLERGWDNNTRNKFVHSTEEVLRKIRKNPKSFPLHRPASDVRKAIINKRISLFYRPKGDKTVELMTFWSSYRDPQNLKL